MPPRRAAAPAFKTSALVIIRELRERVEATKRDLHKERAAAVKTIAEIDQALAELGETASPPPVSTTTKREPPVTRAPREQAAPAAIDASADPVAAELKQLAPWAGALEGNRRKAFDLRMGGMTAQDIAAKLNIDHKAAANAIFQGRARLRELKSRGAPKPAPAPDSDEDPDPAPAPALDWSLIDADTQGWVGRERTPLSDDGDEMAAEEGAEPAPEPAQGTVVPLSDLPDLVASQVRTAPGVPTWILDRLLPAWWIAYQGVVVEKVHPDVVAYLNDTTAQEVSRKAKAAEIQIDRLKVWERDRKADGVPLTDEDKLGTAPAAPDPLLAALGIKQEPKTQGDAKRAAMAAMSEHFHRLAPRQLQLAELYVAGKTNAEIAAEMGVRLPTVDGMLASTRARLEGCARYTPPAEIAPVMPTLRPEIARLPVINPPPDVADTVLDSFKETGVERARAKLRVINGRQRSATIAPRVLSRDERKLGEMLTMPAHIERPITRGDCEADPGRPCPWVSCPHNLYLDVNEDTGAIKLNFPHLEVWEMKESCSLDVAERGGVTLEEVGAILNLTRERIRQVEVRGLDKIRDRGDDMEDARVRDHSPLGAIV